MEGTDFKDFKAELLKKPSIRRQYDALKPKYDIIQQLIARRNELAMSQRDLANIIGTHQPAIARLERGDHDVTIGTLRKVAEALDMNLGINLKARKPALRA